MDKKRPQLNPDELRRLKWLLGGGLALLSLWTVFFLDIEALALTGLAGAAILAVLVWPQLPGRVPPVAWKLAVPAIIAGVAYDFYATPDTLPVLIRLAILLVLYRAVSYRRKREDLQLIVLTLFLIVVAGVLTVSLGFAVLLLAFTACALGFLFVITLAEIGAPAVAAGPPEADAGPPGWVRLGWGRLFRRLREVTDWRLLGFAALLFAGVVAVSAFLFLIIPRFEIATGFFLDRYITRKSRTGFTEQVRFGDVTELVRDESIAMRVDLTDAGSLRELPFWRVVILDEYSPQGFRLSAGLKAELLRSQRVFQFARGRAGVIGPNAVGGDWTFYIEPGVSRFLPLPGSYLSIRLRDPVPVQSHPQTRLVALRSEPMTMTAFQLEGVELRAAIPDGRFAGQLAAALAEGDDGADPRRYDPRLSLRGPEGEENEAALARMVAEITGGQPLGAVAFAERATQWLRDRHAYALSASIPRGSKDDIVKWLESNEPGFCEYFAAGLTVLARAAGHPARVVAGFRGGTLNAYERYIMVRNADAHAWCEIFDGEGAWVRMDPTPGGTAAGEPGVAQAAQQVQDTSWNARWDSLRVIWYRRIVNFDSRQQAEMVEAVRSFTVDGGQALRQRLEAWAQALRAWLARPWDTARAGRVLGGLALVAALAWALWRAARVVGERWASWARPGQLDPVRREASRWLRRLAERVGPGPVPAELAAARAELERLRFGPRESWPEPPAVFRRVRQALRASGSGAV